MACVDYSVPSEVSRRLYLFCWIAAWRVVNAAPIHESAHVVGALVLLQALFMIARLPPAASTTAASTIDKGIIFIAGHLCKGFALPRPLGRITRAVSGEFRLIDCLWSQIKRVSATPKRHLAINRPCGPPPTGDSAVPRIAPNVIVGRSAVGERQLRSAKTRN